MHHFHSFTSALIVEILSPNKLGSDRCDFRRKLFSLNVLFVRLIGVKLGLAVHGEDNINIKIGVCWFYTAVPALSPAKIGGFK